MSTTATGETSAKSSGSLFKRRLFSLVRLSVQLLRTRSQRLLLLLSVLESIQLLAFAFDTEISEARSDYSPVGMMQQLTKVLTVHKFLTNSTAISPTASLSFAIALPIVTFLLCLLSMLKRMKKSWTSVAACYMADIQTRVMYIPLLSLFLTALDCDGAASKIDSGMQCYGSTHAILASLAASAVAILLAISVFHKLMVFDTALDPRSLLAKQSAAHEMLFHVLRTLLVLVSQFVSRMGNGSTIQSVVYMCATIWLFLDLTARAHFYWIFAEHFFRLLCLINALAGIYVLVPNMLSINIEYLTLGLAFTVPVAFVTLYLYTEEQSRAVLARCLANVYSDSPAEGLLREIEAVRIYIEARNHPGFLVSAYLGSHQDSFTEIKKRGLLPALRRGISRIFMVTTAKFPRSISLLVLYITYIVSCTTNLALAWALTEKAMTMRCTPAESFILYSVRKELKQRAGGPEAEQERFAGIQFLLQGAAEAKFCRLVAHTARAYVRFWILLQEESPAQYKFHETGCALLKMNTELERLWGLLKAGRSLPTNLALTYMKFVRDLAQDSERVSEIKLLLSSEERIASSCNDLLLGYANNGASVVSVSAAASTLGLVSNCNAAFSELTGYAHGSLVGTPMESLMPAIYRDEHRGALHERAVEFEEGEVGAFLPSRKSAFILHKTGYTIPVEMKLAAAPSLITKYSFICSLAAGSDWKTYSSAHILLDPELNLAGFTSSLLTLLGPADTISAEVIPRLRSVAECEKARLVGRKGMITMLWTEIKGGTSKRLLGYHVLLTYEDVEPISCEDSSRPTIFSEPKMQFAYSQIAGKFFLGEPAAFVHQERYLSQSTIASPRMRTNTKAEIVKKGQGFYRRLCEQLRNLAVKTDDFTLYNICLAKEDYDRDVITCRLVDGEVVRVDDEQLRLVQEVSHDGFLDSNEGSSSAERKARDRDYAAVVRSTVQNKSTLLKLLKEIPMSEWFARLIFITIFSACVSIALGVVEYIYFRNMFDNLHEQLELSVIQFKQIRCVGEFWSWTMQAVAVNEGVQSLSHAYPGNFTTTDELGDWTLAKLKSLLYEFDTALATVQDASNSDAFQQLYTYTLNYTYNESSLTIQDVKFQTAYYLAMCHGKQIVDTESISTFRRSNPYIASFQYNYLNGLLGVVSRALNDYVLSVQDIFMSQLAQVQTVVYACLGGICFFAVLQLPFALGIVSVIRKQSRLFLLVPPNECAAQQKIAEEFLESLNSSCVVVSAEDGWDSCVDSEDDRGSQDKTADSTVSRTLKVSLGLENALGKRNFSGTFWSQVGFFWRILVVLSLSFAYLYIAYGLSNANFYSVYRFEEASNTTVRIDMGFTRVATGQQSYYWDPGYPITQKNALTTLTGFHDRIYDMTRALLNNYSRIEALFSGVKKDKILRFIFNSMCEDDYTGNCTEGSEARRGYLVVLTEYLNVARNNLLEYKQRSDTRAALDSPDYVRSVHLLYDIIRPGYTYLYDRIIAAVKEKNDSVLGVIMPLLAGFIALTVVIVLYLWIPYVLAKRELLLRSRALLSLVPKDVIVHVKAFRKFFSKVLFQSGK